MTLLELLQAGKIEEFNARRGQRGSPDLFAADLANLNLAGADLSRANLEKADLSGADLTGANLAAANLSGADLTGAILDQVVAVKARMREAYLGEARAADGELTGADLAEADLTGLHAPRIRLTHARLRAAVLTNAHLVDAELSEARLAEADLRGADLTGATLKQADLSRAQCGGTRFERADLSQARLAGTTLRNAILTSAVLRGADLTGADLTDAECDGAELDGADLFDVQANDALLARLQSGGAGADTPEGPVDIHFEEPAVVISGDTAAVLWENADGEDVLTMRVMLCPLGDEVSGVSYALPVPADVVTARAMVARPHGFTAVLFAERPGGVEVLAFDITPEGAITALKPARLGYTPIVRPILTVEGDDVLVHGIGRQGALSVHQLGDGVLTERMRAPAATYRGFCGRLDPVLLGKGGTVASVRPDRIGRLQTAPTGYPGRLTAAALRGDDEAVAVAWTQREERGVRFAEVGGETTRLDPKLDISAVDLAAVGARWLLVWARDADETEVMAAWMPDGAPFRLFEPSLIEDIEDLRMVPGGEPTVAVVGGDGELVLIEVSGNAGRQIARFGA